MFTMMTLMGLAVGSAVHAQAGFGFERDTMATSAGDVTITFIGHGTLMLEFAGKVIHVDPYGKLADYSKLPRADLVLITHSHGDHLDPQALKAITGTGTVTIASSDCVRKLVGAIVMKNGDKRTACGVEIEAVPAYNIVNRRDAATPYHPRGEGNGYVLGFGDKRIYVAGDTENTPEMKALKAIDVAFLPMNLPYTMTPEMVADAARSFKPAILYPYHYGETDPAALTALLKAEKGIDVRIRRMK